MDYPELFRPLKVGGVTLKNRLISAPTSLAQLGPDENLDESNIAYYELKAMGGHRRGQPGGHSRGKDPSPHDTAGYR